MAAIDELIHSKNEKLAELREETAKITNIVNEDDITKAVGMWFLWQHLLLLFLCLLPHVRAGRLEVLRKSSKERGTQRSPRPNANVCSCCSHELDRKSVV